MSPEQIQLANLAMTDGGDGASNIAPPPDAPGVITHKGRDYPYTPLDPEALIALLEAELARAKTPSMDRAIAEYDAAGKAGRPDIQKEIMDRAYSDLSPKARVVTKSQIVEFVESLDGMVWLLWRHLLQSDPQATRELAREIMIAEGVRVRKLRAEVVDKARQTAATIPPEG